jgi:hypothetical protein
MTSTFTDADVIQQIAGSILAPKIEVAAPPERVTRESIFYYRAIGGVGIEITVDWSANLVYTLIWQPTGSTIPIGYKNDQGVEVKMFLQVALQRLGIDISTFKAANSKLGGKKENIPRLIDLAIQLLFENLDTLNSNVNKLFP